MPRLRWLPIMAIAVFASVGLAACGDDEDEDTTTQASEGGAGLLFTQTAGAGTFNPVEGEDDVYDLTLTDTAPAVTSFTDRPVRQASTESLADFVGQWEQRGFADDPPNAALVLDEESDDADTSVFELEDPKYDQATGDVTYRATHIDQGTAALPGSDEGGLPPAKFTHAHLFIDPGTTATAGFFLRVTGAPAGAKTNLTLDSPFTVLVGPGAQEAAWAGPTGGGFIGGSRISLTSSGEVELQVAGGSPPITGTAQVPSGANATVQVGDGPTKQIQSGEFSVGG